MLIPLWEADGTVWTALTLRASTLNAHAGQIAFPGGRRDAEDSSLLATALREAHEEVGLPPSQAQVCAQLDDMWSIHRYIVTPFVAWLDEPPEFRLEPAEIERLIVADVRAMLAPSVYTRADIERGEQRFVMHAYTVGDDVVWGLTGGLLHQFFELLHGRSLGPESDGHATLVRYLDEGESA